jgi:hypothetical protein
MAGNLSYDVFVAMKTGPPPDALPDAMKPGFHCVRTHWNQWQWVTARPQAHGFPF